MTRVVGQARATTVPAAVVVANDERVTSIFALAWTERGVGASCVVTPSSLRPTSPRSTVRARASGPNTVVGLSANWRPLTMWTCTQIATVADRLWTASGARCLGICHPWPSPSRTRDPSGQVHDRPRQKPVALDELRCDARDHLHTLGKRAGGLATKRSVFQHDRSLSRNF